jgi:carboxypeptidase C (cathepsin A)
MMSRFVRCWTILAALALCGVASAATAPPGHGAESAGPPAQAAELAERRFVSSHRGVFGGVDVNYTATAEDTFLKNSKGEKAGALFSFSYVKQGVKDPTTRPVTFVFNGGPGSSSVWIHMGALGPYRVVLEDAVHPPTGGPFRVAPNSLSPLDVTDLVFIDPIGTGFSRVIGTGKPEDFYGVEEDGKATLDFIEQWLTKNRRWVSPKYVVGESYGTVRAAVLAKLMGGGPSGGGVLPGVSLNGIAIVGTALSFPAEDIGAQGLLPSLAATAWHHGKIDKKGRTFDAFMREVREFDGTDYAVALYAGSRLPESQRRAIAGRLAEFTGLSDAFVLEHNLRISAHDFAVEILRDQHQNVGMYDARFTLPSPGDAGDPVADDPAMGQYSAAFVAAFHQYIRDELAVTLDQPYEFIAFAEVGSRWSWGHAGPLASHAEDLEAAMRRNPSMKLFVMSGYYDLVTPFAQAEYTVGHTAIPVDRVQYKTYESGHMVYLGEAAARAFVADIRELVSGSSKDHAQK